MINFRLLPLSRTQHESYCSWESLACLCRKQGKQSPCWNICYGANVEFSKGNSQPITNVYLTSLILFSLGATKSSNKQYACTLDSAWPLNHFRVSCIYLSASKILVISQFNVEKLLLSVILSLFQFCQLTLSCHL